MYNCIWTVECWLISEYLSSATSLFLEIHPSISLTRILRTSRPSWSCTGHSKWDRFILCWQALLLIFFSGTGFFTSQRMVALLSCRFLEIDVDDNWYKRAKLNIFLITSINLFWSERPWILGDRRADHGALLRPQVLPQDRGGARILYISFTLTNFAAKVSHHQQQMLKNFSHTTSSSKDEEFGFGRKSIPNIP